MSSPDEFPHSCCVLPRNQPQHHIFCWEEERTLCTYIQFWRPTSGSTRHRMPTIPLGLGICRIILFAPQYYCSVLNQPPTRSHHHPKNSLQFRLPRARISTSGISSCRGITVQTVSVFTFDRERWWLWSGFRYIIKVRLFCGIAQWNIIISYTLTALLCIYLCNRGWHWGSSSTKGIYHHYYRSGIIHSMTVGASGSARENSIPCRVLSSR